MRELEPVEDEDCQQFTRLRDQCLEEGVLFEDPEFPADDSSLYFSQSAPRNFEWLRPNVSNILMHLFLNDLTLIS